MKIVDLTLPVRSGMAGIPGIAFYERYPVRVEAVTVLDESQRDLLRAEGVAVADNAPASTSMNTVLTLNSHIGTHIDAPRHFIREGAPIDRLPLERLVMRTAVVLDVSHKRPGEGVDARDLEATGAKPAADEVAVVRTGWTDRAWGTPSFWQESVYLDPSVGEWTAAREVAAVAMDCFPEKPFWRMTVTPEERGANHRRWLGAGIPMIQMLTNLGQLGPRFTIIALPLKLTGMDGSPARVVGVAD